MPSNTLIVIAGPTASGKTGLSIKLAKHFQTGILSADSRQCYQELNIGVAKPSQAQLNEVDHYFINSHSIHQSVNAGSYEKYGLEKLAILFEKNQVAIVTGGTGLYIKALCEGVDPMPVIDQDIRTSLKVKYETYGLSWLQDEVAAKDPQFWEIAERQNPQRLLRALEFKIQTNQSITDFRQGQQAQRDFKIIKISLEPDRQTLYKNINDRVDDMIEMGLEKEARSLLPYRSLNALQTVGYSELFDYFDKQISLDMAIEKIKINTRHYAKRQITWFKKDKDFLWFSPLNYEKILSCLKSIL